MDTLQLVTVLGQGLIAIATVITTALTCRKTLQSNNDIILFRISALEKKVEKHNNVVERTYELEKQMAITQEKLEFIQEEH